MKSTVDKYGFGQLDSWFIDTYLRHDGETLEDAKIRIATDREQQKSKKPEKCGPDPKTQTKF